MPEPGATPQPQIKQGQGPEALPWGEAAQVNDLVGLVPPPEEDTYTPTTDQEKFIYGQTDRPQEPFSAGLPFGEGQGPAMETGDPGQAEVVRIAQAAAQDPRAPKELKAFANRVRQGM